MSELTEKDMEARINSRQQRFFDAEDVVWDIRRKLDNLEKCSGNSSEFKLLEHAVTAFENQLRADFYRFKKITERNSDRRHEIDLQESLNRERKLRFELERKVKEASESSGLFISYVRKKLKI